MKRRILLLVLILASLMPLFSGVEDLYRPFRLRTEAMGGASVSSAKADDILYANPALISSDEAYFLLPSVSFSLYNFNRLLERGGPLYMLLSMDNWSNVDLISGLIDSIGYGDGELASANLSASLISGITSLGFDTTLALHTTGRGAENSTVIVEANVSGALGLAIPVELGPVTFRAGVSARLNFRFYTIESMDSNTPGGFSASRIIAMIQDEDIASAILNSTPVAAGISIPVDLGMAFEFPYGFNAGLVWRGLNSTFHMQTWDGINQLYNSVTGGYILTPPTSGEAGDNFTFRSSSTVDIGFSWQPEKHFLTKWIKPSIAFDISDITGLFSDLSGEAFVRHSHIGAELQFMNTFSIQAGLNQGYMSLGLDFNLQIFHVGIVYATYEYGETLGDKPLDSLSFRFSMGYGK